MTEKKPDPKVVHKAGEFQLDKKALLEPIPFVAKGLVGAFIDACNNADLDHNGQADVAQYAPFVIAAVPLLLEIAPHIDLPLVKEWFVSHEFVLDKSAVEASLNGVLHIANEAVEATKKV